MEIAKSLFPFSLDESIINRIDDFILPLKEVGCLHFGNIRIFNNKKIYRIANNKEWSHIFFENKFYNELDFSCFKNIPFNHFYHRILFSEPIGQHDKTLYEFGLWNILLVYRKNITHFDYWFFCGSSSNKQIIEFYINNLKYIEAFIALFQVNNQDIYNNIDKKNTFSLDYENTLFSENAASIPLTVFIEKIKKTNNSLSLSFSDRELECLFYMHKGRSMKEIARYLEISSRTVEDYINNIKRKTGCVSKSKLLDFAEISYLKQIIKEPVDC